MREHVEPKNTVVYHLDDDTGGHRCKRQHVIDAPRTLLHSPVVPFDFRHVFTLSDDVHMYLHLGQIATHVLEFVVH